MLGKAGRLQSNRLIGLAALLLAVLASLIALPAQAQTFPELTGRVVDQAELLSPAQEAELTQKSEALQRAAGRQLVVATVSSLQDNPIEDYGYQLGRHWRIGQQGVRGGEVGDLGAARLDHRVDLTAPRIAHGGERVDRERAGARRDQRHPE